MILETASAHRHRCGAHQVELPTSLHLRAVGNPSWNRKIRHFPGAMGFPPLKVRGGLHPFLHILGVGLVISRTKPKNHHRGGGRAGTKGRNASRASRARCECGLQCVTVKIRPLNRRRLPSRLHSPPTVAAEGLRMHPRAVRC